MAVFGEQGIIQNDSVMSCIKIEYFDSHVLA